MRFFLPVPNNKDLVKKKGLCLELVCTVDSAECQGATEASFPGVKWLPAPPTAISKCVLKFSGSHFPKHEEPVLFCHQPSFK